MSRFNSRHLLWLLDNYVSSMRLHTIVFGLTFCLLLSACSGPRTITDEDSPREATMQEKLRALPQYETFDPSPYPSELVEEEGEIELI